MIFQFKNLVEHDLDVVAGVPRKEEGIKRVEATIGFAAAFFAMRQIVGSRSI